jgi:hypothetical protein
MNILNIANNLYKDWLSYEGEYINEAFDLRDDVHLLKWGEYRDGINQSLKYSDSLDHCMSIHFKGSFADVVVVSINDIFTMKVDGSTLLLDWIKKNRSSFMLLIRVNDPWRFSNQIKIAVLDLLADHIFIPSSYYKERFEGAYCYNKTKFHLLPYCIGRRYLNFGIDREYDIAMIGRCQVNQKTVNPYAFRFKYKVFYEKQLSYVRKRLNKKDYFSRINNTVINLNKSKASLNSPVVVEDGQSIYHTPFRYLESAACGAISISSQSFPELNKLYFPKFTYIDCNNSIIEIKKNLDAIKKHPEDFYDLQLSAYKFVMQNHQGYNRVEFIIDLIKGRKNINALDYYKIGM